MSAYLHNLAMVCAVVIALSSFVFVGAYLCEKSVARFGGWITLGIAAAIYIFGFSAVLTWIKP